MRYILIYYKKSKYMGFVKKYILETNSIWELNQILKDKNVVEYELYELKGSDKNGR